MGCIIPLFLVAALLSSLSRGTRVQSQAGLISDKAAVERNVLVRRNDLVTVAKTCQQQNPSDSFAIQWRLTENGVAIDAPPSSAGISIVENATGSHLILEPIKMAPSRQPESFTCTVRHSLSGSVYDNASFAFAIVDVAEPRKVSSLYDYRDFKALGRSDDTLDVPCAVAKRKGVPLTVSWFQYRSPGSDIEPVAWESNKSDSFSAYQVRPRGGPRLESLEASILVLTNRSLETDYACRIEIENEKGGDVIEKIIRFDFEPSSFSPSTSTIPVSTIPVSTQANSTTAKGEEETEFSSSPSSPLRTSSPSTIDSETLSPSLSSSSSSYLLPAIATPLSITLMLAFAFAVWIIKKKKTANGHWRTVEPKPIEERLPVAVPSPARRGVESFESLILSDEAIPFEALTLKAELGRGYYGQVCLAEWATDESRVLVAVKRVQGGWWRNVKASANLVRELGMMMKIGRHKNIIEHLGYTIGDDGCPMIVMEYALKGSLLDYLYKCNQPEGCERKAVLPDTKIYKFGRDIARGMAYLEESKVIHRDLAARNVLVFEDDSLKVSDFGLAKDLTLYDYYRSQAGQEALPVKWMALETLESNTSKFTYASDCWSYGIVLWEITALGHSPYQSVPVFELLTYLKSGKRLQRPASCPNELYDVMMKCWDACPKARPNFRHLVQTMGNFLVAEENRQACQAFRLKSRI